MSEPTSSDDRLTYAGFPQALRDAMKIAAQRFEWTRDDWRMQTNMIQDVIADGWYSADEIAKAYAAAPPRETT